jgi:nucleotide-binding universal stress UspA family protein
MAKPTQTKLVWAFDPFAPSLINPADWSAFLQGIAKTEKAKIEPVYVLSPDAVNWTGEFSGQWTKKYMPLAKMAGQKSLASFKDVPFKPLKVVVNRRASLRGDAAAVSQHAKREKADMIIAQSHARTGVARLFLGSFVESLVLQSQVPVLCVNPLQRLPARIGHVLYPTDLSAASKKSFKWLLAHCQRWGAKMTLFYKLPDLIEPLVQSGVYMAGGGWISIADYYKREGESARVELAKWQAEGEKAGVTVKLRVVDKPGLTADAINQEAEAAKVDIIAMSSQATATSSIFVGSVTRQVLRQAPAPVLIFHSKSK